MNIGNNKTWFDMRIWSFKDEIYDQADNWDLEYRKQQRWGNAYALARSIQTEFKRIDTNNHNRLLLIPHQKYIDAVGLQTSMPEPVVFYYYSQIKAAYPASPNVYQCTHGIKASNGHLYVTTFTSKADIDSLLADYQRTENTIQ